MRKSADPAPLRTRLISALDALNEADIRRFLTAVEHDCIAAEHTRDQLWSREAATGGLSRAEQMRLDWAIRHSGALRRVLARAGVRQ